MEAAAFVPYEAPWARTFFERVSEHAATGTRLVETAALAAVKPPRPAARPALLDAARPGGPAAAMFVASHDGRGLSCAQAEAVIAAAAAFEGPRLPAEPGAPPMARGWMLGDGTGVGKGRVMAALARLHVLAATAAAGRGAPAGRVLWLSVRQDLWRDAQRDLRDVYADEVRIIRQDELPPASRRLTKSSGLLFISYRRLLGRTFRTKEKHNLMQVVSWLRGGGGAPLIMLDECHRAKNLTGDTGAGPSLTAQAIELLQLELPDAKVVYSSATALSNPNHLFYVSRLGLGNMGFESRDQLVAALKRSDKVAVLELTSLALKASGAYACRTLSFAGSEFELAEVPLPPQSFDARYYSSAAELLTVMAAAVAAMCRRHGPRFKATNAVFWGRHQSFFKLVLMGAKVPAVVDLARAALRRGDAVVLALQSTGEAAARRAGEPATAGGESLEEERFDDDEEELEWDSEVEDEPPPPRRRRRAGGGGGGGYSEDEEGEGDPEPYFTSTTQEMLLHFIQSRLLRVHAEQLMRADGGDSDEESADEAEMVPAIGYISLQEAARFRAAAARIALERRLVVGGAALRRRGVPAAVATAVLRGVKAADEAAGAAEAAAAAAADAFAPVPLSTFKAMCRAMADAARGLRLPRNPLDSLIDALGGPSCVAELTGRTRRDVADPRTGRLVRERRSKAATEHDRDAFQDGAKLVAIISDACSTGLSLHADRSAVNRRRRVHITLELPWSAERAVQQFGRTHRSGQLSAPRYILVQTAAGGERRFAAAAAGRLAALGALLRGDRLAADAGASAGLRPFDIMTPVGRKAFVHVLKSFEAMGHYSPGTHAGPAPPEALPPAAAAAAARGRPGSASWALPPAGLHPGPAASFASPWFAFYAARLRDMGLLKTSDHGVPEIVASRANVRVFLNRLLGLPVHDQEQLFDYFSAHLGCLTEHLRAVGKLDLGIAALRGRSVTVTRRERVPMAALPPPLAEPPGLGGGLDLDAPAAAADAGAILELEHAVVAVDRGMSWAEALAARDAADLAADAEVERAAAVPRVVVPRAAWYEQRAGPEQHGLYKLHGVRTPFVALALPAPGGSVLVRRPHTGGEASEVPLSRIEFEGQYRPCSEERAKMLWEIWFDYTEERCLHGDGCKTGRGCAYGRRIKRVHVFAGLALVKMWGRLEALHAAFLEDKEKKQMARLQAQAAAGDRDAAARHAAAAAAAAAADASAAGARRRRGNGDAPSLRVVRVTSGDGASVVGLQLDGAAEADYWKAQLVGESGAAAAAALETAAGLRREAAAAGGAARGRGRLAAAAAPPRRAGPGPPWPGPAAAPRPQQQAQRAPPPRAEGPGAGGGLLELDPWGWSAPPPPARAAPPPACAPPPRAPPPPRAAAPPPARTPPPPPPPPRVDAVLARELAIMMAVPVRVAERALAAAGGDIHAALDALVAALGGAGDGGPEPPPQGLPLAGGAAGGGAKPPPKPPQKRPLDLLDLVLDDDEPPPKPPPQQVQQRQAHAQQPLVIDCTGDSDGDEWERAPQQRRQPLVLDFTVDSDGEEVGWPAGGGHFYGARRRRRAGPPAKRRRGGGGK